MPKFDKKRTRNRFNPSFRGKTNRPQVHREYQHQNQLREIDVGITEFINTFEGFSGVIKARFSDFQVNEIDPDGQIAKLTNLEIPKFGTTVEKADAPADSPLSQIPQETWLGLKQMLDEAEPPLIELDVSEMTKEDRTEIHKSLKKYFGGKISANTETKNDKKFMVFKKHDGKIDNRSNWPSDKGEFVHFLVYKECLDTLDTALRIASCLKMPPAHFSYAGVKDRRAKTTQWFSVKRVEPWKLMVKTRPIRNVKIGNITFKDKPLKLGDLTGNKFRIALRNVTGDDDLIEKSLKSLQDKGFVNYYGLQRFGNDKEVPTFSVGIQLLLGNWKEACDIILKLTKSDQPDLDVSKAKKVYAETGDPEKALAQFESKNSCIEYLLLSGLSKEHKNDYVNALASIPRNTRLLYIHSFQSLVWNLIASKRIEKYGLKVVPGDLILLENLKENSEDDEDCGENKKEPVKELTDEECANYTIYDIVLPLPGYDITYPENMKDCYKEILEKYGLTLEMTRQKVRTYTLSGTYRKLMGQVQNLSWKIMYYNDPNDNLIRSDLEELKGEKEPASVEGGKYKALLLDFCLDSSSYATMVLREILKSDTSSSSHAKLNNYHVATAKPEEKTCEENEFSDKVGLLNDSQKYEAFKNIVFSEDDTSLKRKCEEENGEKAKVAKT
ncbi:pseudouridylate synthase 7 homolog [Tribolium castaneum]|uniref:Pseudouridylate synthase 7 homolog-like Protein n=1 Tax=Tribolium castaneum TaxID=7070 RepID=D6WWF9_TRICA|nr:PREDICTED: pseudouridylate synthase 7 homolog [Tribolium castaneum]EFA08141.1 Pseudouridylate synthase 7 homolog-like Protein [Tribolium castaneum]|eukprot:XP_973949.1 PREDICTED: pseudouridylate synthase 7 homolog [Tribolium castaneum]